MNQPRENGKFAKSNGVTRDIRRRLMRLARILDTAPEEKFDMGSFGYCDSHARTVPGTKLGACGTTACALGWATLLPESVKAGWALAVDRFGSFIYMKNGQHAGINGFQSEFFTDEDRGDWVGQLWYETSIGTPKAMAAHIRAQVAANGGTR